MVKSIAEDEIREVINNLVRYVDPNNGNPNTAALWEFIRDVGLLRLNVKNMGYDLARVLGDMRDCDVPNSIPNVELGWRASTQADIESDWNAYWCNQLQIRPVYHRKVWELTYVLHNLWFHGMIRSGARGIGFGCGEEPIPSYLANHGVAITATDLPPDHESSKDWQKTGQHAENISNIWYPNLVDKDKFDHNVFLVFADMNQIPSSLKEFDFCWSICAFEHLGSIKSGLNFVENSLETLRNGGISIHTTEFNFTDGDTIDNWPTVLFKKEHFMELAERLKGKGHYVSSMNFDVGDDPLDRFIDIPPYGDLPSSMTSINEHPAHLKLSVGGLPSTCYGLVVRKGG